MNVVNDRGDRILFNMKKEGSSWKILGDRLPDWIIEGEVDLGQAIEDELQYW